MPRKAAEADHREIVVRRFSSDGAPGFFANGVEIRTKRNTYQDMASIMSHLDTHNAGVGEHCSFQDFGDYIRMSLPDKRVLYIWRTDSGILVKSSRLFYYRESPEEGAELREEIEAVACVAVSLSRLLVIADGSIPGGCSASYAAGWWRKRPIALRDTLA